MNLLSLTRKTDTEWWIEPHGAMRVPGIIYGSESLVSDMDPKVYEQVANVAMLPGIERASYAMPDAHWGYGFPIGGVAAFDADKGGVVSAGGVGFDISCGVRLLSTGLITEVVEPVKKRLADELYRSVPAGLGSIGRLHLDAAEMNAMLAGGARWAVDRGYGTAADLDRIEEHGCMAGAKPEEISDRAKTRQCDEMGTLGSGNHYLEVQKVVKILDRAAATAFGLAKDDVVVSIHCGSRGLGHQIGTEFLRKMAIAAPGFGIDLPDRELACAPIESPLGQAYLGAMRGAINCALANRQIITHLVRGVFATHLSARRVETALRCVAQHLQGRGASSRRNDETAVRAPQGRDARVRSRSPGSAARVRVDRPAGADWRNHGNRVVCDGRHQRRSRALVRIVVPWRRTQHESASGRQTVERPTAR